MKSLRKKEARLLHLLGTKHVRQNLEHNGTKAVAVQFNIAHLIKKQSTVEGPEFYYYTVRDGCEEWCP